MLLGLALGLLLAPVLDRLLLSRLRAWWRYDGRGPSEMRGKSYW